VVRLKGRIGASLAALVLVLAGCAALRPGSGEPADQARRQAEQMVSAQTRGDWTRAVRFAYPPAVEEAGGPERMIAGVRRLTKEVEDAGGTWRSTTVAPATQVVTEGGTMYAVLPTTTRWSFQGRDTSTTSYLLGVSSDGGKTWTFAHGVGLLHLPLRRKLFPSLPSSLVLPVPELHGFTAPP
jgi:hypothetical protein